MTTRLTRWLTALDNFEAKMALLPAVRRYGRLTAPRVWYWRPPVSSFRWAQPALLSVRTALKPKKWNRKWSVLTANVCF
ncbi:ATPase FliI/YscN [Salmonella enterica subsp. houtenae]|nr:ATPase FliI/YscN [Salmonella enterica subsp. houtenae]